MPKFVAMPKETSRSPQGGVAVALFGVKAAKFRADQSAPCAMPSVQRMLVTL